MLTVLSLWLAAVKGLLTGSPSPAGPLNGGGTDEVVPPDAAPAAAAVVAVVPLAMASRQIVCGCSLGGQGSHLKETHKHYFG